MVFPTPPLNDAQVIIIELHSSHNDRVLLYSSCQKFTTVKNRNARSMNIQNVAISKTQKSRYSDVIVRRRCDLEGGLIAEAMSNYTVCVVGGRLPVEGIYQECHQERSAASITSGRCFSKIDVRFLKYVILGYTLIRRQVPLPKYVRIGLFFDFIDRCRNRL